MVTASRLLLLACVVAAADAFSFSGASSTEYARSVLIRRASCARRKPGFFSRSAPGGATVRCAGAKSGVCDAAARRYWDGMNRRDVDFALEQFSDNIFFQDMLFQQPIRGKDELRAHFDRYRTHTRTRMRARTHTSCHCHMPIIPTHTAGHIMYANIFP